MSCAAAVSEAGKRIHHYVPLSLVIELKQDQALATTARPAYFFSLSPPPPLTLR